MSQFHTEMLQAKPLEQFARKQKHDTEDIMEELIYALWLAMFFAASARWTELGVANLEAERTLLLAKCFDKGQ